MIGFIDYVHVLGTFLMEQGVDLERESTERLQSNQIQVGVPAIALALFFEHLTEDITPNWCPSYSTKIKEIKLSETDEGLRVQIFNSGGKLDCSLTEEINFKVAALNALRSTFPVPLVDDKPN